ncbi:hypothetical protein A6770_37085 [Nostoc minutum NIES-26]|uniref:Uncharacterized protein n=1 Tax=Nostoc minutum NIES-26 TaxID=1844469 RepID=A0A367S0C7_9NOSO|nr:hypothetical protein A6770_37085 [Nostoc minutum NIES-26]
MQVSRRPPKQELGVEVIASHEDPLSAAPAVPNFSDQTSHVATLMDENPFSQEPKDHHEGQSSALADSNPEKWSHEAVVARSKARPGRMEKLKMAEQLRENPGVEFLMECWDDDPALRIVIKKLVAKFPQWGLVAVDGVLVKWDE